MWLGRPSEHGPGFHSHPQAKRWCVFLKFRGEIYVSLIHTHILLTKGCDKNLPFKIFHLCLFTLIQETMENVKKCKNFLSTLIKLASSGKQSTETAANVKELVQNLLVRNLDLTFPFP